MKNLLLLISAFVTSVTMSSSAASLPDEGMWIPILIEKYNIRLMQEKGFKLSAEDIYSVNKACMKDAVVSMGGCTGELISPDGLMITNHHCGYGRIQSLSSMEHDYLTNGFWAMSRQEELPCPGMFVTILKRMEDVTDKVLQGVTEGMDDTRRDEIINTNSEAIRKSAIEGSNYTASIRPFYMGNQYFLFVNETFNDVRLVGAPPSAIGKFGGETDNWVWPRHTGDFSMFRIYANSDNKPAPYSKTNVPYRPVYHFPISLKGVNEGDFTMVFGYPGSTSEYVPSYHIEMVKDHINPKMIAIRTKKIEIMEEAMNSDPLIRLQYSAKKSGIANAWKKWIGENQGLERMNTVAEKKEYERRLTDWIRQDETRQKKYGNILPRYRELYDQLKDYSLVNSYTNDVFFNNGAEAVGFARYMVAFAGLYESNAEQGKIDIAKHDLLSTAKGFFKNYNIDTDKKLFEAVMSMYGENLDVKWLAPEYITIREQCRGDFRKFAGKEYPRSVFTDSVRFYAFLNTFGKGSLSKLSKDPFYRLAKSTSGFLAEKVRGEFMRLSSEIQRLNKDYMTLQMEFDKEKIFYPDANSTLRVAYGTVQGYLSRDAVYFKHFSTLKGIMEKDNPEIYDYDVPDKLRQLYKNRDFGKFTQNGEVPVCFIANNHTTGGNSGSPVINAEGHLIGINFDRAWEGVASDMAFNPDQSRNISLDIRFVLFIIDKYAEADYLLKEMTIIE